MSIISYRGKIKVGAIEAKQETNTTEEYKQN